MKIFRFSVLLLWLQQFHGRTVKGHPQPHQCQQVAKVGHGFQRLHRLNHLLAIPGGLGDQLPTPHRIQQLTRGGVRLPIGLQPQGQHLRTGEQITTLGQLHHGSMV